MHKERAQKNKAEKENLEALDTDLRDIEQELQGYMVTSAPRGTHTLYNILKIGSTYYQCIRACAFGTLVVVF